MNLIQFKKNNKKDFLMKRKKKFYILILEIYQISTNMLKEYGVFFKCWLGHELHIIIQDPKDLEVSAIYAAVGVCYGIIVWLFF